MRLLERLPVTHRQACGRPPRRRHYRDAQSNGELIWTDLLR